MPGNSNEKTNAIPIPPAARHESTLLFTIVLTYYLLLALGAIAVIVWLPELRAAGAVALTLALGLAPIALHRAKTQTPNTTDQRALLRGFDHMSKRLEVMVHEGGLTEAAKRVLHRREERDLLCRAIEQDIEDGDWEAAMVLVRELAERFGYRVDAEEFRSRIEEARAKTLDRSVAKAMRQFETLLAERRWGEAHREAAKIGRLFPDSPRVDNLNDRVDAERRQYKIDLEHKFLHAAQRDEVDRAMGLLKQLDEYLSESEAEQLREVARGVVGKARDNLGARFKLLVEDKDWAQAAHVGERIIKEFPNTRMAEEVSEMIESLHTRASSAGVPTRSTETLNP